MVSTILFTTACLLGLAGVALRARAATPVLVAPRAGVLTAFRGTGLSISETTGAAATTNRCTAISDRTVVELPAGRPLS